MTPLFARVLLEREAPEKIGKILVPQEHQKRLAQTKGKVLSVGPTAEDDIKALVGKVVLFGKFAGDWIKDESGRDIYICQEEDLLAVCDA